jgi:hypothetical protein
MNHSEFIQLVQDMRDAQKKYFANRKAPSETRYYYLKAALDLENEVDQIMQTIDRNCNHQTLQFHQTRLDANTTPIHHTPSGE